MRTENNQKKKLLTLGLTLLVIILLILKLFSGGNNQKKIKIAPTEKATLSIVSSQTERELNKVFPVTVKLDVKNQKIGFAQVRIIFDRNLLNVASEIQTTPLMGNVIKKSTPTEANGSGTIEIILGVAVDKIESAPRGAIDLATINFRGLKQGSTNISFDSKGAEIVRMDTETIPTQNLSANFILK
jgi:hypothetical protein